MILLISMLATIAHADIYKCTSDTNKVSFQDSPCESENNQKSPHSVNRDFLVKGKQKENTFLPADQTWQVIEATPTYDLAKDLKGIPTILKGSHIHFSENYYTFKNLNMSGDMVIGACFALDDSSLMAYPIGKFQKYGSLEQKFKFKNEYLETTLYGKVRVKLKQITLSGNDNIRDSHQAILKKVNNRYHNNKPTECKTMVKRFKDYHDFVANLPSLEEIAEKLPTSYNKPSSLPNIKSQDSSFSISSLLSGDELMPFLDSWHTKRKNCEINWMINQKPELTERMLTIDLKNYWLRPYDRAVDSTISAKEIKNFKLDAQKECFKKHISEYLQ